MVSARFPSCCSIFSRISLLVTESRRLNNSATARTPPYDSAAEFPQCFQFLPNHRGDLVDDLGRDLVEVGHAHGHVGPQIDGSETSNAAACGASRCDNTSATVWGCSLCTNFASCCGSAFCNASRLTASAPKALTSRSTSLLAVSGPKAFIEHAARIVEAPFDGEVPRHAHLVELFHH